MYYSMNNNLPLVAEHMPTNQKENETHEKGEELVPVTHTGHHFSLCCRRGRNKVGADLVQFLDKEDVMRENRL